MESYTKTYRDHTYQVILRPYNIDFAVYRYKDGEELSCKIFGLLKVAKAEYKKQVELLKVIK